MTLKDSYQVITDSIIEGLQEGIKTGNTPWSKPWTGSVDSQPHNAGTRRKYRGINTIILWSKAVAKGYESQGWLTFNQARKLGGRVTAGEKATSVALWKFPKVEVKDEDGNVQIKTIPLLKLYSVFNLDQTTGVKLPKRRDAQTEEEFDPIAAADAIVEGYKTKPPIAHNGGDRAFYRPREDTLHLPKKTDFHSVDEYYSTLFHELGHSTGHSSRLDRFDHETKLAAFGSELYSKEELVAEFTSAFLCAESGIDSTRDNSVAYIQSWIKALQNDVKLAPQAAGKAQRAADYILGVTPTKQTEEDSNG
jgi:antirestriction protein ArdC